MSRSNIFPRIPERQHNLLPRYRRRNLKGIDPEIPKIVTAMRHKRVDVWFVFEEKGFSVLDSEQFHQLYIPSNTEAKIANQQHTRRMREEHPTAP